MNKNSSKPENYEVIELDILGMSCVNCANSIKSYLTKVDGIYNIEINFTSEVAGIEYNPNLITKENIISDIRKMGYDVMEDENEEETEKLKKKNLRLHRNKIIVSIILSIIIFSMTMSMHSDFFSLIKLPNNITLGILFLLSTISVFWCGDRFYKGALSALRNRTSDMNSLISLGVFSSYFYSLLISANHVFKLGINALESSHDVYYETAAMIISFILIGNYLEAVLKTRTQTSIKKLKELQAKFVNVIRNGEEISVPFKKVRLMDMVLIKSGDKIPVDGK